MGEEEALAFLEAGGLSIPYLPAGRAILRSVERQMAGHKFDPSLVIGVTALCRFGHPRVAVCSPLNNGLPFPTTFWLTCPSTARRAAAAESAGGVAALERLLEGSEETRAAWRAYNVLHQEIRRALLIGRPTAAMASEPKLGMGGIKMTERVHVKCLHLQAASRLALGFHPASDWLDGQLAIWSDCLAGGLLPEDCMVSETNFPSLNLSTLRA
jgi:hypothetical protein